jgi:hypothetical protein
VADVRESREELTVPTMVAHRADGRRPDHRGIHLGDGRMLVAPRTGDLVRHPAITRPPDGIRRIV